MKSWPTPAGHTERRVGRPQSLGEPFQLDTVRDKVEATGQSAVAASGQILVAANTLNCHRGSVEYEVPRGPGTTALLPETFGVEVSCPRLFFSLLPRRYERR
jgi:hypothetical protein